MSPGFGDHSMKKNDNREGMCVCVCERECVVCVCVCVCVSRDEREVRGQVWWILPVLVVWLLVFMSQKARRLLTYNGNCNLGLTRTWSHKKRSGAGRRTDKKESE